MTQKVITIGEDVDLFKAQEKMAHHRIRHLPVVDDEERLIGIITDRDIRSALPLRLLKDPRNMPVGEDGRSIRVGEVMTRDPFTISPVDTIQDALLLIQEKRVGAFPVVDEDRKVKGILSVRDLLRAFTNVLGIGEPGSLLGIVVEEKVGQLKKIVDAITEENVSFGSVLVARYWEPDKRAVFPYLLTQDVRRVKKKLEKMGYKLLDPMEWHLDQLP